MEDLLVIEQDGVRTLAPASSLQRHELWHDEERFTVHKTVWSINGREVKSDVHVFQKQGLDLSANTATLG